MEVGQSDSEPNELPDSTIPVARARLFLNHCEGIADCRLISERLPKLRKQPSTYGQGEYTPSSYTLHSTL